LTSCTVDILLIIQSIIIIILLASSIHHVDKINPNNTQNEMMSIWGMNEIFDELKQQHNNKLFRQLFSSPS
jgi:hypothetical protein